jgi:hypothetical protein
MQTRGHRPDARSGWSSGRNASGTSQWYRTFGAAVLAAWCVSACTDVPSVDSVADRLGAAVTRVNCGGGAASPFGADAFFSGGNTYATTNGVATSGVANAAPEAVYRSERWGNHTYTFTGLTPGASYVVRLHFAEIYWTTVGARVFNVVVNGAAALTNFDIVAVAGANRAVVRDVTTTASSAGRIAVQYVTVRDNAKSSGIEIFASDGGPPPAPAPAIDSVAPATGPTTGGTTVTLTGANLATGATVTVCGAAATGVAVVSASQLTAVTPAHAAGACDVVVGNPDGQTATRAAAFTYAASTPPPAAIRWVQTSNGGRDATSATFAAPQTAGGLNVVVVGWADASTTITAVTDTRGNTYAVAVPMATTATTPSLRQAIYYARNIAAGANTVTVAFSATPSYPDLRISEYAGLDATSPLDVTASATGTNAGAAVSSGAATTTSPNELVVGAGMTSWSFTGAGPSFTQRVITGDGNLAEDRIVNAAGSYAASGVLSGESQDWIFQMATFRAGAPPPCVPTTCAARGADCGSLLDGCGGTLTCGTCTAPATCGGSGTPNVCGAPSGMRTYATEFSLDETPISESGAWVHTGLDWTTVATSNGLAFGTQTGFDGYDDSYAYLSGTWPDNQSASAVIHLESGLTRYQEVEVLLRWRDSGHYATGYECNLAFDGQYAQCGRWPGPLGHDVSEYTTICEVWPVPGGVHDGDVLQADIIGNRITLRLNGTVIATGVDSAPLTGGAPGVGFFAQGSHASQQFSFTRYSATGLP